MSNVSKLEGTEPRKLSDSIVGIFLNYKFVLQEAKKVTVADRLLLENLDDMLTVTRKAENEGDFDKVLEAMAKLQPLKDKIEKATKTLSIKKTIAAEKSVDSDDEDELKEAIKRYFAVESAVRFVEQLEEEKGAIGYYRGDDSYMVKTQHWEIERNSKTKQIVSDMKYYRSSQMIHSFQKELPSNAALRVLREIIEGDLINEHHPIDEKAPVISYQGPKMVYDRLVNSVKTIDDKTFNMLDLSDCLVPSTDPEVLKAAERPWVFTALLTALGGGLQEQIEWLEEWLYATVFADIGNNQASIPIINGPGKIGKNALTEIVLPIFLNKEVCITTTWNNYLSNFTGFKKGKVVAGIDEVSFMRNMDQLKNMTGSKAELLKEKYGPELIVENTIKYIMFSNEPLTPIPIQNGRQMERFSPIKASKDFIFAEVVYDNSVALFGEGWIEKELSLKTDLDGIENSRYAKGDAYLRLNEDGWANQETCQQWLNFMHNKFHVEGKSFRYSPLRGEYWAELLRIKGDLVVATVAEIVKFDLDALTLDDLYSVYEVLHSERTETNKCSKKTPNNFCAEVSGIMEDAGYEHHKRHNVEVLTTLGQYAKTEEKTTISRLTVFKKPHVGPLVTPQFNELTVETEVNAVKKRVLRTPPEPTSDFDEILAMVSKGTE